MCGLCREKRCSSGGSLPSGGDSFTPSAKGRGQEPGVEIDDPSHYATNLDRMRD